MEIVTLVVIVVDTQSVVTPTLGAHLETVVTIEIFFAAGLKMRGASSFQLFHVLSESPCFCRASKKI